MVRKANQRGVGRFGSLAMAQRIVDRWRVDIEKAARRARISEALLIAVIMVESGGNSRAVSPAGASGLAQLMPGTARRYGVRNIFDPTQNLRGGADYLSDLLNMFENDMVLALAAYNSGENAVARHGGVPPYAETRAYVPRVLSAFLTASNLCRQPPRNARRRCSLRR
ncbi:MAG: lytic transglycosylase domain-containing protein [Pseudomonadota bacterium]